MSVKLQKGQKLVHVTRIMLCETQNASFYSVRVIPSAVGLCQTAFYVTGFDWMGSLAPVPHTKLQKNVASWVWTSSCGAGE